MFVVKLRSRKAKRWVRVGALGLVALFILVELSAFFVAKQIVAPPRREIMDYHQRWLDGRVSQAIYLEHGITAKGGISYSLATPQAQNDQSERGAKMREQLGRLINQEQELSSLRLPEWGETLATIVILHGRKGRKEDLYALADRFCAVGFRCLHLDMPGHGENFSQQSAGYGLLEGEEDFASQALAEVAREQGFEGEAAFLWGMSMGGAYAARELGQEAPAGGGFPWRAGVVVSSFDYLDGVIEQEAGRRMGVLGQMFAPLVKANLAVFFRLETAKVRPVDWLAQAQCPVMVVHGSQDELFTLERGKALYEAIEEQEKSWIEVTDAEHGNVLSTEQEIVAPMALWFLTKL